MNKIILLHHLSIEIMGREFSPQGFFQHSMVIVVTAGILSFATYGLISFVKKFLTENSKAIPEVSRSRESSIINP